LYDGYVISHSCHQEVSCNDLKQMQFLFSFWNWWTDPRIWTWSVMSASTSLPFQPHWTYLVPGGEIQQQHHQLKWVRNGSCDNRYVGEIIGAGLFFVLVGYKVKACSAT